MARIGDLKALVVARCSDEFWFMGAGVGDDELVVLVQHDRGEEARRALASIPDAGHIRIRLMDAITTRPEPAPTRDEEPDDADDAELLPDELDSLRAHVSKLTR